MTQIAATTAAMGSKGVHAAKGSAGARQAEGTDFASLFGALDPSADDDGSMADTSLASDDAGTGTGSGGAKDKGEGGIVLDLGLEAAAQSAMADTVVAAQPQAAAELPGAKGEAIASLDTGVVPARPSWRGARDAAIPTMNPSGQEAVTPEAATTPVAGTKPSKGDKVTTITQPVETTGAGAPTQTPVAKTQTAAAVPTQDAAGQAPVQQAVGEALPRTETAATRPGARKVADAAPPARSDDGGVQDAPQAPVTDATTPALPPIFAALPQVVRDAKQASATPATPAEAAAAATVQLAAGEAPVAPADTSARPVMSALHRAVPAGAHASTATQTEQAVPAAGTGRRDTGENGRDQGKGSDANASARLNDDGATTAAADATASTATPFSDILQSLPPIAQSRIGLSPVVTGPADVGATLQGQVIDMGVGGQWIDRMAKEITAMSEGTGHSRFQLSPPNLGRIQVDIRQGEGGGQVQILTETDEAARRLRDGKGDLQADARMSALSINSITIDRAQAGFDGGRDQSGQQRHQSAQQQWGQQGTQTGSQDSGQGSRNPQQSAMQAGTQGGSQSGSQSGSQGQQNSANQGKDPWNRDVLRERAGTMAQDGSSVRPNGDRLVRYA